MLALLLLSIGLAMDAFAVSLVRGATGERSFARALELGLAFGLAQGLMPLVGWGLSLALAERIERIDHWIAFALLLLLGGRMLFEAARDDGEADGNAGHHGRLLSLLLAAFATSIDAAVAGQALPLFGIAIPLACLTIGVTTALLCTAGYWLAGHAGAVLGRRAEGLGGLVLIGLGSNILVEHLSA